MRKIIITILSFFFCINFILTFNKAIRSQNIFYYKKENINDYVINNEIKKNIFIYNKINMLNQNKYKIRKKYKIILNNIYNFIKITKIYNYKYIYIYLSDIYHCINKIFISVSNNEIRIYEYKNDTLIENIFIKINKNIYYIKNIFFNKNIISINKNILKRIDKKNNKKIIYNNKISFLFNYNTINKNIIKIIAIKLYIYNKNYFSIKISNNFYNKELKLLNKIKYNKFPIYGDLKITSLFNFKRINPIISKKIAHKGIDISVLKNTPVFSIENGIVTKSSYNKKAGNFLVINHNNKFITKYMHLNKIFVIIGQFVNSNSMIALSGNSGMSTGPHLHFEIWINKKAKNPINLKFKLKKK